MSYTLVEVEHFDPTYPLFPVLAFTGFALTVLPSYWHFKSGNVGTIMFMIWTFLGCGIYGINSILWAGNLKDRGWFWCDLTTKIMVGMSVGVPAAALAIHRRLYRIATIRQVQVSRRENLKNMWIELALTVGAPVLMMVIHVVSQGHRFDIIENIGCWPSLYVTPVAVVTIQIWPIIIASVSLVYASLSIRAFLKQRKQFSNVLQSANSGLSVSRYFRLMALAATEVVVALPFAAYMLVTNILNGVSPWISWEDTHLNFNRVEYIPFGVFKLWPDTWILLNVSRYLLPAQGFFFFFYLGLSGESGVFYRRQFWKVAQLLGFMKPVNGTTSASWVARPGASAPSHLRGLPPYAATASVTSSAGKKGTPSIDLYPMSPRNKTNSSTDSLSLPPGIDDDMEKPASPIPAHPPAREVADNVA